MRSTGRTQSRQPSTAGRRTLAAEIASAEPLGLRCELAPPPWVAEVMGRGVERHVSAPTGFLHEAVASSDRFTLVTVRASDATRLSVPEFQQRTEEAYGLISRRLHERNGRANHPVRFWNYIPQIHRPEGGGLDRYMVFNAGRFAACSNWLGGPESFSRSLATASGVGHHGADLVVHALATDAPGTAIDNPRQIPPYRYSRRFGPRPPCFARATIIRNEDDRQLVLVGGTASIRGENSMFAGDVVGQCGETFANLEALIGQASQAETGREASVQQSGLGDFRDLRVYHTRREDRSQIAPLVDAAFPQLRRVEYVLADLCRAELLVEIEGLAEIGSQS